MLGIKFVSNSPYISFYSSTSLQSSYITIIYLHRVQKCIQLEIQTMARNMVHMYVNTAATKKLAK